MNGKLVFSLIGSILMLIFSIIGIISFGLTITTLSTIAIFILFSYDLYKYWKLKD